MPMDLANIERRRMESRAWIVECRLALENLRRGVFSSLKTRLLSASLSAALMLCERRLGFQS